MIFSGHPYTRDKPCNTVKYRELAERWEEGRKWYGWASGKRLQGPGGFGGGAERACKASTEGLIRLGGIGGEAEDAWRPSEGLTRAWGAWENGLKRSGGCGGNAFKA